MENTFPKLITKHLVMRQLKIEDAKNVFELFSDPDTMKLDGGQTMKTAQEAYQFIQYFSVYQPGSHSIRWAITDRETGIFYGTSGFYKINYANRRAEIGGEILKKHWRKGVGTESLNELINFGFNKFGLNRITAMVSTKNEAALRLVKESPFIHEGCLRQWENWNNEWIDVNVFSLLREDFSMKSTF